jgi:electron transport complex protein RnfD
MKMGPFLRHENATDKMMRNLFIALMPILIFGFYKNGILPFLHGYATIYGMLYPLLLVFVSVMTSYVSEYFFIRILKGRSKEETKKELKQSFWIFPGLFLSLIVPYNTPLVLMAIASFIASILGKMLYGGFGYNLFNPALIGCLFLLTIYGAQIATMGGYLNTEEIRVVSGATPLANVSLVDGIGTYETLVEPYGTLASFFLGTIPGAMGETSACLCLLAFFFLSYKRVIKWKIPTFYIGTVFLLTCIIGSMNGVGLWYPIFQVLSGGLFFGAVFMATDPVTSPITSIGQVLYAILLGILTVAFRYLSPLPEGVLTSILTMNLFVPILDKIGSSRGNASKKMALPLFICCFFSFLLIRQVVGKYTKTEERDSNFSVVSEEKNGNQTTYIVMQKGNGGLIQSKLTLEDGKVLSFQVLEEHETDAYYQMVMDANYIDTLLKKQNQIEEVDTISGATISSKALKKTMINVLKEAGVLK